MLTILRVWHYLQQTDSYSEQLCTIQRSTSISHFSAKSTNSKTDFPLCSKKLLIFRRKLCLSWTLSGSHPRLWTSPISIHLRKCLPTCPTPPQGGASTHSLLRRRDDGRHEPHTTPRRCKHPLPTSATAPAPVYSTLTTNFPKFLFSPIALWASPI